MDARRIAVGGDSAGGNLAAAVTLMARDRGGPALAFQLLVYPVTDHSSTRRHIAAFGRGFRADSEAAMRWFWTQYLARPDDGNNPLASPLKADLRGLPPALVLTAEFDPLRDEGEAYAARLARPECVWKPSATTGSFTASSRWAASWTKASRPSMMPRRRCGLRSGGYARAPDEVLRSRPQPDRKAMPVTPASIGVTRPAVATVFSIPRGRVASVAIGRRGEGGDLGPDLSDVGGKYERSLLIESVLDPSRQIVEGYRPTVVATADGRVLSGIVKGESANELTLVDADGRRQVVRKSEIEKRWPTIHRSCPTGWPPGSSLGDFADLIAYLEGLRSAGQGTPGSGSHWPITLPARLLASERVAAGHHRRDRPGCRRRRPGLRVRADRHPAGRQGRGAPVQAFSDRGGG